MADKYLNIGGLPVKLVDNGDGTYSVSVGTNIVIDSVTATDITLKDATDPGKKLKVNSDGSVNTQLTGSRVVVIANAVAITDSTTKTYNLITQGLLTEAQIRQFSDFKITINNSHNQVASITVLSGFPALGLTNPVGAAVLYVESGILDATSGRLILQSAAGGTGATAQHKIIPALKGVHGNILVQALFNVAPTSGSLSITIEMR